MTDESCHINQSVIDAAVEFTTTETAKKCESLTDPSNNSLQNRSQQAEPIIETALTELSFLCKKISISENGSINEKPNENKKKSKKFRSRSAKSKKKVKGCNNDNNSSQSFQPTMITGINNGHPQKNNFMAQRNGILQTQSQYYSNLMQHPLLARTINSVPGCSSQYYQLRDVKNQIPNSTPISPKRNQQAKKKDAVFENYISQELAMAGLANNTLFEGVIRINPKQFSHAYVTVADGSDRDIFIDGMVNRNRALDGDIVVVQIIEQSDEKDGEEERKRGKVVFIKEKIHNRTCIGRLRLMADKNKTRALFVPRDSRVPRLNIPFTSWPDNFYQDAKKYEETLFLAKITDWFCVKFAVGSIICFIGQSGDMVSETKAILAQNGLDISPYGSEFREFFPGLDFTLSDIDLKGREDCRHLCVFSIDPANCRDIDDAVSCKLLEDGNYEIGVHISDVAHFLTEGTIFDVKVQSKATTIYLVDKAYHMLPEELCMLCSLFPGRDKLAFSVFWVINQDGHVMSHRFAKTVINSCCQLSYDHAQNILDDCENSEKDFPQVYNDVKYSEIYNTIKVLGSLSSIFRKRRFDSGAMKVDQPRITFHLNPADGLPDSFWIYENKESHQLIEEFMLLANMTVARRIYEDHPDIAFLRSHPPPNMYMLKQLKKSLEPLGINMDIESAGDLHKSLLPYTGPECSDMGKALVLNMLFTKPLKRAIYMCSHGKHDEDFHHYALNVPMYTHFTSPIRRYADIMVHRLLAASLKYRDTPKWDADYVRTVAAQCNTKKYCAKRASEMSAEIYTLKYIEINSPVVLDAVVVEIREKFMDVIVIAMGLNRRIFFDNEFPGKYNCIKNDEKRKLTVMELTWNATDDSPEIQQTIHVFSMLKVEMRKVEDMFKVDTKILKPVLQK